MATEDIRVEHRKSAETAAFDIKNRVLVLPIWKDMSNSMYDMLVAHEVSHALNTPFEEWEVAKSSVKNEGAFMQVCNVVEDARIERLIKQQYAGIRKDFSRAYAEIHAIDLFELKDKNVADLGLIDRLNIEFKLGLFGHVQVPFSAEEQQYVTRMANTETFADVIELSKELLENWEEEQDQRGQGQQGEGQEGEGQEGQGQQGQGQSSTSESTDGVSDGAEQQSPTSQPNLDDIKGQQDSNENGEQDGSEDGQDGSEHGQDTDGREGSDGENGENGENDSSYDYDDYTNNSGSAPSETQRAFDQNKKELVDSSCNDRTYNTLPTSMVLDKIIIDTDAVNAIWEAHENMLRKSDADNPEYTRYESYQKGRNESRTEFDSFLRSKKAVVNHMVSQFIMKQSADEDRRTSIAKSGVLDTTAMMSYKWSEEIFASNQVVADGKNHGMIFFLDWSGSMGGIIKDTVEQLIILTEFCNKASIPFEVYAFSDRNDLQPERTYDNDGNETELQYTADENSSNQLKPHQYSLINFVSSRSNKKDYRTQCERLYHLAVRNYGQSPRKFDMGCTPLNEAIVSAMDIVPAFQEATKVQIVNAVFLTDGHGHGMGLGGGYRSDVICHDPVTRKDYAVNQRQAFAETNTYLEILKDRTGCNLVGIYLHNNRAIHNLRYSHLNDDDITEATKTWKSSNYAVASEDRTSYDECYIIKANIGTDDDALENLDEDASFAKIRNAFKKSANNNKTNKIIATKMIEVFASTLSK